MRIFLLFVVVVNLFLLGACKKYKAAEDAFFIKATKVTVTSSTGQQISHKITDLWLYVNGKYQGAYPVGHLMPVARKGESVRINVFAGIKNNGIADTRIPYPFYDFITYDTTVATGKTIEHSFDFKYKASATTTLNETFDGNLGLFFKKSDVSSNDSVIFDIAAPEDCFEKKSGILELPYNGFNQTAQIESSGTGFSLPTGSANVYLELNYKCNTGFSVGLISSDGNLTEAIGINPQENWNKIYISLATAVNSNPNSSKYKVYIKFVKAETEDADKKVFLDNIKLIYF